MTVWKRYEYWASENGTPMKKWTRWFKWNSPSMEKIELRGFKGDVLKCEYMETSGLEPPNC